MPAIFTHVQFGREVLAALPRQLQALCEAHPQAFYLGTQGPDILFYHKPTQKKTRNPARKKGWDMHAENAEDFFAHAARVLLADVNNYDREGKFFPATAEAAYVLGFLCHFTLDSACHPFIDEHSRDGLTHGKIESELDKVQLRKEGLPVRGFNAAKLFFPAEESEAAATKLLGVSQKQMHVAMHSMRKINGLFSHKRDFIHRFCLAALALVGQNKTFGEMFLHKEDDPRFAPLLPQLTALFNGAIPTASDAVLDYFEHLSSYAHGNGVKKEFYRRNYSGV